MDSKYGLWESTHALSFNHPEYGSLIRDEHGTWRQVHSSDGARLLKSETLKDAFVEAESPFKKAKVKVAKKQAEEPKKNKKPKIKKTSKKKK